MAIVTVRVIPRSGRTQVLRGPGGEVVIRVRSAPEGGRATAQAAAALASLLGLPKSAVTLRSGARSRIKIFVVDGVSQDRLSEVIDGL
ncbi:MAG TPA: DUF167 family protein [Actinomycetota bacterium]|nr:DUF167 family protein [Actinomycetota bacterium]